MHMWEEPQKVLIIRSVLHGLIPTKQSHTAEIPTQSCHNMVVKTVQTLKAHFLLVFKTYSFQYLFRNLSNWYFSTVICWNLKDPSKWTTGKKVFCGCCNRIRVTDRAGRPLQFLELCKLRPERICEDGPGDGEPRFSTPWWKWTCGTVTNKLHQTPKPRAKSSVAETMMQLSVMNTSTFRAKVPSGYVAGSLSPCCQLKCTNV